MDSLRPYFGIVGAGIILGLAGLWIRAHWWPSIGDQRIEQAVIIRETGVDKPITKELAALYAAAPGFGVMVIDDDTLGPGKQPSPTLKPFLNAAAGKELPVLVLRYSGGKIEVEPLPATIDELQKRIGK
jgi:hypothetical protein